MSSHVSLIINPMNKILDVNQKYRLNEKLISGVNLNHLIKIIGLILVLHQTPMILVIKQQLDGDYLKLNLKKYNTRCGETNNLKIYSVTKEKPPEYT